MNRLERKRKVINGVNRRLMWLPTSIKGDYIPQSSEAANRTEVRTTINKNYNKLPKSNKSKPKSFDELWNTLKN